MHILRYMIDRLPITMSN